MEAIKFLDWTFIFETFYIELYTELYRDCIDKYILFLVLLIFGGYK